MKLSEIKIRSFVTKELKAITGGKIVNYNHTPVPVPEEDDTEYDGDGREGGLGSQRF